MSAFETIVIGKSSIPSLIITVLLMIAIPVCLFIYWRRKHKEQTKIIWLIAGAVGFLVSSRVLELGVHFFCIISDNPVSRFINGNTAVFVLYGITMAGVFEECGRRGDWLLGGNRRNLLESASLQYAADDAGHSEPLFAFAIDLPRGLCLFIDHGGNRLFRHCGSFGIFRARR